MTCVSSDVYTGGRTLPLSCRPSEPGINYCYREDRWRTNSTVCMQLLTCFTSFTSCHAGPLSLASTTATAKTGGELVLSCFTSFTSCHAGPLSLASTTATAKTGE